jgi:hypothetical protein
MIPAKFSPSAGTKGAPRKHDSHRWSAANAWQGALAGGAGHAATVTAARNAVDDRPGTQRSRPRWAFCRRAITAVALLADPTGQNGDQLGKTLIRRQRRRIIRGPLASGKGLG